MPRMSRLIPPLLAATVVLVAVPLTRPLDAQILKGHDTSAPVEFSADHMEVQDRADRVVVSGDVKVHQAGMELDAQRLTVAYHNKGGLEIDRLDASGNVVITRGKERASGDVAIYDLNRKIITLIGHVSLKQGTNQLHGSRLVIDLASGRATVDGASAPGITSEGSGRVSGTFTVSGQADNASEPPQN